MINKLIILYLLDGVDFPISSGQIMELILGRGYMDYITLQELLSELKDAGMIISEKKSTRTEYTITATGHTTMEYLHENLSYEIRKEIKAYVKSNALAMKNEICVESDYYKTTSHEYEVSCAVKEGACDLIRLNITVPTAVQAEEVCLNWKKKNEELYAHIMMELL